MRKILEVSGKPLITSECWTYYKMSVIQTGRGFENWFNNTYEIEQSNSNLTMRSA